MWYILLHKKRARERKAEMPKSGETANAKAKMLKSGDSLIHALIFGLVEERNNEIFNRH